jgi:phosphoglycolate phosphatase
LPLRNIIFDWSGTLVDDLPAVWRASNHVLRQAGLAEMSLDQFRAEFRLPFRDFYDRHTPGVPMAQLEEWFHGHFRTAQDSVVALPHAREFLEFCRARSLRTFILSSVHADHWEVQHTRTGLGTLLGRAYIQVLDKRETIHRLLHENDLHPGETLFIGDMEHDIETARHGGVRSCAVLTGYNRLDQLRAAAPDLIVEHLGELRSLLERDDLEFPPALTAHNGHGPQPIITVGALISNDAGEVLMVRTHKWSGLWGIPGGKTKWRETSEDALRRELLEETALQVDRVRFVLVQDCIGSKEFYRDAHFVLLNYTCRAPGVQPVRLNEEAQEFRWLPPRDALALLLNQPTRTLLEAVLHDAR